MSAIQLSVKHNTTLKDAQESLERAVEDIETRFGTLVREVKWSADRREVTLSGPGVIVDLKLDETHVHATGDIPLLGKLLGSGVGQRISEGLGGALKKHFPRGISQRK